MWHDCKYTKNLVPKLLVNLLVKWPIYAESLQCENSMFFCYAWSINCSTSWAGFNIKTIFSGVRISIMKIRQSSGPCFNIKMSSYQYRKYHCGDKTILRPSYLHNGISYTGRTTSLYWIRALRPSYIYVGNSYTGKMASSNEMPPRSADDMTKVTHHPIKYWWNWCVWPYHR